MRWGGGWLASTPPPCTTEGQKLFSRTLDLATSRAQNFFYGSVISEGRKTQKTEREGAGAHQGPTTGPRNEKGKEF